MFFMTILAIGFSFQWFLILSIKLIIIQILHHYGLFSAGKDGRDKIDMTTEMWVWYWLFEAFRVYNALFMKYENLFLYYRG